MTEKNETEHVVDASNLPRFRIQGPLIDRLVGAVVDLIEARTGRERAETTCAIAIAGKANIEAMMTRQEQEDMRKEIQRLRQQNAALTHNKQQRFGSEYPRREQPPHQQQPQVAAEQTEAHPEQPKARKTRTPKQQRDQNDERPFNGIAGLDKLDLNTANDSLAR